jgi:uncharacterized membrane protein YqjE
LEIIQRLRLLMKELVIQLELHGSLLKIEWQEEKDRIRKILCMVSLGFAFALCWLLSLGFFVIAANWSGEYRLLSIAILSAVYLTGLVLCWLRFNTLVARGAQSFAASREELAADIALIRSRL